MSLGVHVSPETDASLETVVSLDPASSTSLKTKSIITEITTQQLLLTRQQQNLLLGHSLVLVQLPQEEVHML